MKKETKGQKDEIQTEGGLTDRADETLLCAGFPGTGKSFFYCNDIDLVTLDSDSSKFDKKDFPENYIKHIKENLGRVDIIFISTHKDVREALVKHKLNFSLVYPQKGLKNEYIDRYKKRGSDENFVRLLETNWDAWITELEQQEGCTHTKLKSGEYISDIIRKTCT